MSESAGPGSPQFFMCSKARTDSGGYWRGSGAVLWFHQVKRTGRTRPYRPKRGCALGIRSLREVHEYRCRCGHVGWSNHSDILREPLADRRITEELTRSDRRPGDLYH